MRSTKLNRKYYLHSKIKKQGYSYNSYLKTIEIPHGTETVSKELTELNLIYGYNLQITLI